MPMLCLGICNNVRSVTNEPVSASVCFGSVFQLYYRP